METNTASIVTPLTTDQNIEVQLHFFAKALPAYQQYFIAGINNSRLCLLIPKAIGFQDDSAVWIYKNNQWVSTDEIVVVFDNSSWHVITCEVADAKTI